MTLCWLVTTASDYGERENSITREPTNCYHFKGRPPNTSNLPQLINLTNPLTLIWQHLEYPDIYSGRHGHSILS